MESIWNAARENKKKSGEKHGFWSQSGASLREVKKDREREENRKKKAAESRLRSLENAYGSISFSVNKEQQVEITVARQRAFEERGLREDQKRLDEGHQTPVQVGASKGYTDSHHKKDSALTWKEDISVTPERIMEELRCLSRMTRQETLNDMIPSLIPEQVQGDRDFHYNLLKKIKKNLSETMQEAQHIEKEPSAAVFDAVNLFQREEEADREDESGAGARQTHECVPQ